MEPTAILIETPASGNESHRFRLKQCLEIREKVFVQAQHVPREIDVDGLDGACDHLLLLCEGKPVGTMRIRKTENGSKFERIAILDGYRGRHLGALLVHCALSVADRPVYLHAQTRSEGFYRNLGFEVEDPAIFYEAGIPHKTMQFPAESQGETFPCNITRLS
jgi:predicted GNAT family N-acyltransferase